MIDRRPLAVLRCTGNEDVRAALDFAAEVDVPVAVRGGGHSVAGHGVVDGVVVIDLSPMAAVTGDEGQSRVREAFGVLRPARRHQGTLRSRESALREPEH
jgi:FAD/FMN-containing dehydrogenase